MQGKIPRHTLNNNIENFKSVYEPLVNSDETDIFYSNQTEIIRLKIDSILYEIAELDSLLLQEDYLNIPTELEVSKLNAMQYLKLQVDSFFQIKKQIEVKHNTKVVLSKQRNNLISPQNIFEQNEKIANNVFFETLDNWVSTLDSQQLTLIGPIAHQCITEGGRGVIKARQLYRMIYPTANFSDIDVSCAGNRNTEDPSIFSKKDGSGNKILIKPNPATDVLSIECLAECKLPLNLTLRSIDNCKIIEKRLDNYISILNINNLPQGFYFCTVSTKDNMVESFKIIIIRN